MNTEMILTGAQDALTVRRVFGEPLRVDNVTIVPVAVVSGGGGGGGGGRDERSGAGFGIKARPAGVFVVTASDVRWRPAVDVNRVILGGQIVAITALLVLRPLLTAWFSRRSQ